MKMRCSAALCTAGRGKMEIHVAQRARAGKMLVRSFSGSVRRRFAVELKWKGGEVVARRRTEQGGNGEMKDSAWVRSRGRK